MTAEKRSKLYLTQAHVGALATVGVALAYSVEVADFFKGLTIGIMIIPLIVMLIRRFRDEYIDTLWHAGTSLAFAVTVFVFLGLPLLQRFGDGLIDGREISAKIAGFSAIAAFYIGFHYRWLRDRI